MLQDGSYVRLILAPETRRGTIREVSNAQGKERFLFKLDPRFSDRLDDFYVFSDEIEECECPSDEEVRRINALIARDQYST